MTIVMKRTTNIKKSSPKEAKGENSPSHLIDARIKKLGDWRGETLARVRSIIRQADPDVVEEVKWRKPSNAMLGVPVWEHDGIICTGETYKAAVKLTFAKGASLADPSGLFNASLEGNMRRAIDIHEGDKINEKALKALIREAAALNVVESRARRQSSLRQREQRFALLDDVGGEFAAGDVAGIFRRMGRSGGDEEHVAGLERHRRVVLDLIFERALDDIDDLFARMRMLGEGDARLDVDAHLDDFASGNAEILPLQIGALDLRWLGQRGVWRQGACSDQGGGREGSCRFHQIVGHVQLHGFVGGGEGGIG
jgi:hypothetical protein